jgi:predicted membrane protein
MNMKHASKTLKLVLSAGFLALGLILPFFTAQIREIGNMLLPMHIPVLICGFVCGWQYGLAVGFITPLLRSMVFGMPPMFPTATAMAFELASYGAVSGLLYRALPKKNVSVYISLIGAMIAGRLIWGLINVPIYGIAGKAYSWQIFMGGAFLNAIPGIILQLVMIPIIIIALQRAGIMEK